MKEVKLFIASSLDGYIAREDGSVDWCFTDADYGYKEFYDSIDAVMMGRKTYEKALEFEEHPYKEKKCYVFTGDSKLKLGKDIEIVTNVLDFTKELVRSSSKGIWLVGGSEIVSLLLDSGLIDEIILSIHPIILGKGIPLFKGIEKQTNLRMLKCITYESGLVQVRYKVLY